MQKRRVVGILDCNVTFGGAAVFTRQLSAAHKNIYISQSIIAKKNDRQQRGAYIRRKTIGAGCSYLGKYRVAEDVCANSIKKITYMFL